MQISQDHIKAAQIAGNFKNFRLLLILRIIAVNFYAFPLIVACGGLEKTPVLQTIYASTIPIGDIEKSPKNDGILVSIAPRIPQPNLVRKENESKADWVERNTIERKRIIRDTINNPIGYVSLINVSGKVINHQMIKGLVSPRNMEWYKDSLYILDRFKILVFDIESLKLSETIERPDKEEARLVNIKTSEDGDIFVSDSSGKIFSIISKQLMLVYNPQKHSSRVNVFALQDDKILLERPTKQTISKSDSFAILNPGLYTTETVSISKLPSLAIVSIKGLNGISSYFRYRNQTFALGRNCAIAMIATDGRHIILSKASKTEICLDSTIVKDELFVTTIPLGKNFKTEVYKICVVKNFLKTITKQMNL